MKLTLIIIAALASLAILSVIILHDGDATDTAPLEGLSALKEDSEFSVPEVPISPRPLDREVDEQTSPIDPEPVAEEPPLSGPSVLVRVVDRHGRGRRGVPVRLRSAGAGGGGETTKITGRDGQARFFNLPPTAPEGFSAELEMMDPPPAQTVIPSLAPQAVMFRLPPIGNLQLHLVEEGGELVRETASFSITALDRNAGVVNGVLVGGESRVYNIPTLLDLEVVVKTLGGEELRVQCLGPRREDHSLKLRIPIPSTNSIVGILIDEHGAPVMAALRAELCDSSGALNAQKDCRSDASGRFRFTIPSALLADQEVFVAIRAVDGTDSRVAKGSLSLKLPGEQDLGPLIFKALPLVASGFVVDPKGGGIPDVLLTATLKSALPRGRSAPIEAITGENGRFELRGEVTPNSLCFLTADSLGWVPPKPLSIRCPQKELRIELVPSLRVEARLHPEDQYLASRLTATIHRLDERSGLQRPQFSRNGSWLWNDLAPGRYRLRISLPWGELAREDIDFDLRRKAPAPATLRSIRLRPIRKVTLRIRGEFAPIVHARVVVQGKPQRIIRLSNDRGCVELLVNPRSPPLSILAPGYERQNLPGIDQDTTIEMVVKELPAESPLPAGERHR